MFILQNEEKLFQVSYPKQMQCILGKYSLIIATGELHRKLKSFAVSFISTSKSSPEFLHFVEKMSLSMMDSWKTSKEVSFYKEVKAVLYTSMPLTKVKMRLSYIFGIQPLNFDSKFSKYFKIFQKYPKAV
jgi:hypothetical protein